jgi:hypothetical protein
MTSSQFIPLLFKIGNRVLSSVKKRVEKKYTTFRFLKKYLSITVPLQDNYNSIYSHTLYAYEELKGSEYLKLFYLADSQRTFKDAYNDGNNSNLSLKLEEILHTNPQALFLKKNIVDIKAEIDLFSELFSKKVFEAAPQSTKELYKTEKRYFTTLNEIKLALTPESDIQKINDPFYFVKQVKVDSNIIPRTVSHYTELKKISYAFYRSKLTLKEAIVKYKKIVLLANGGVGKSTELKVLAHSFSFPEFIPVFISLRTYTNKQIDDILPTEWQHVDQEKLLIIIDGLDEVNQANFLIAVQNILSFIEKYKDINIIVSCRTNFFNLPIADNVDTFDNVFVPVFLNDIDLDSPEVKEFIINKFNIKFEKFVRELFDKDLRDLATNPYYLNQILDQYTLNNTLNQNRAILFDQFLTKNINFDRGKYNLSTTDLKLRSDKVLILMEKLALGMEILGKNYLTSQELTGIIDEDDRSKFIIYSLSFRKMEGEDEKWQFDHSLLQEYLAAKALSKLDVNTILQFIAFEPNYTRIMPSWINTLTFLFSILPNEDTRFAYLLEQILKNDPELLVKIEREKISEITRNQIFQNIYNYYKGYNILINSNKFNFKDLAFFGQTKENVKFVFNEIENYSSNSSVLINALNIASHFKYDDLELDQLRSLALNVIRNNSSQFELIYSSIYTLTDSNAHNQQSVDDIVKLLDSIENEQVRSSIYATILATKNIELYFDRVLEGYKKFLENEKKNISSNDSYYLRECIKSIDTEKGVKSIIEFFHNQEQFEYTYGAEDLLAIHLKKAALFYPTDHTFYEVVFNYMLNEFKNVRISKSDLFIEFFKETNTRRKALDDAWRLNDEFGTGKSLIIAKLIDLDFMHFVAEQFKKQLLTPFEVSELISEMRFIKNPISEVFEKLLNDTCSFKGPESKSSETEEIRQEKRKLEFDILFDSDELKKEVIRIFSSENKIQFTEDELSEIRSGKSKNDDLFIAYNVSAIRFLRGFDLIVRKQNVLGFFDDEVGYEYYRISLIYQFLKNFKAHSVTDRQEEIIKNWCFAEIRKFDFSNAVKKEGNKITFQRSPVWLSFFMRKFDFAYPTETMLDMLSFDYIEGNEYVGFNDIVMKVDKKLINQRISSNLLNPVIDPKVVKNYIKYAAEHKLTGSYARILSILSDHSIDVHSRDDMLDIYYNGSNDQEGLNQIFKDVEPTLKWNIAARLIDSNNTRILEKNLEAILNENNADSFKASTFLVQLQNRTGLDYCVTDILGRERDNLEHFSYLTALNKIEFVPNLIKLLKFSYQNKSNFRGFDDLNNTVKTTLHNLAIESQENLNKVSQSLKDFIHENGQQYQEANYLIHSIESMENTYYMQKSRKYSVKEMKDKLKLIYT